MATRRTWLRIAQAVLASAAMSPRSAHAAGIASATVQNTAVPDAQNQWTTAQWRTFNTAIFRQPAPDRKALAAQAYIWGMPLLHAAMLREKFALGVGDRPGSPLNQFVHSRTLAGPETRIGVGLNNDTVYSLAWVDLAAGPLVLTAPNFGDLYYTFSMNFADTSASQSLGQRSNGSQLPPVFIYGPGYHGATPKSMVLVPSPTRFLNIAGRILVRTPADYPSVHKLQDQLRLTRWHDWKAGRFRPAPPVSSAPLTRPEETLSENLSFLTKLNGILQQWHITHQDRAVIRALRTIGIGPGLAFNPNKLSARQRTEIEAGVEEGRRLVLARSLQLGVRRNGWMINYNGPRFGTDFLLRAGVAKDQPNVAIPEEALYPIARVDSSGDPLTGHNRYQIRFAPGQLPPVDAFWSITAYDDKGNMIANPAKRYSVGDRSPDLARDPGGGVTVILSASTKETISPQNWLPVPHDGPFYLMLRLYRPRKEVLERSWLPPAIERIG